MNATPPLPHTQDLSPYQSAHQLTRTPSPLEFVSYLFGLGNLLAGPFYEFSDYKAFMSLKGVRGVEGVCGREEGERGTQRGG